MTIKEISLAGTVVGDSQLKTSPSKGVEMARLWLLDEVPTFFVNDNLWERPEMWGIILSDFMQHIANAYQNKGFDRSEIIEKINSAYIAESNNPTSKAESL